MISRTRALPTLERRTLQWFYRAPNVSCQPTARARGARVPELYGPVFAPPSLGEVQRPVPATANRLGRPPTTIRLRSAHFRNSDVTPNSWRRAASPARLRYGGDRVIQCKAERCSRKGFCEASVVSVKGAAIRATATFFCAPPRSQ